MEKDECTHYFYKNLLLDFMRDLPETFDRNTTTLKEAYDIIFTFMRSHGLCGKGCEEKDKNSYGYSLRSPCQCGVQYFEMTMGGGYCKKCGNPYKDFKNEVE